MREWTVSLPWQSPPLSLNDRMHYKLKARWTKTVRGTAFFLARQARIPELARVEVQLLYAPRDGRRRDEDNLVATLKPLCDGLVDAQVVADDDPAHMVKLIPRILPPQRPPAMWLRIRELEAPR